MSKLKKTQTSSKQEYKFEAIFLMFFLIIYTGLAEAVVWRYSVGNLFLEISQTSQEHTCASGLQLY